MGTLTAAVKDAVAHAYDFGRHSSVADPGGGQGAALRVLLTAHPHLTGVLMDLPHTLEAGADDDSAAGSRITRFPGRLPDDIPPGADPYLLRNTLHGLPPDLARRTLERLRDQMHRPGQRLLLVEAVIQPGNGFGWSKLTDIEVLVNDGGREHRLDEWRALLAACGFRLTGAEEISHPQWLLEAAPR